MARGRGDGQGGEGSPLRRYGMGNGGETQPNPNSLHNSTKLKDDRNHNKQTMATKQHMGKEGGREGKGRGVTSKAIR